MRGDLVRANLVILTVTLMSVFYLERFVRFLPILWRNAPLLPWDLLISNVVTIFVTIFIAALALSASLYAFKVKTPRSHRIMRAILGFLLAIHAVLLAISFASLFLFLSPSSPSPDEGAIFTVALLLYLNWNRRDVRGLYGIIDEVPQELSDEIELLNYIRGKGGVYRRSEAARALGISLTRVLHAERSLVEDGLIVYV